MHAHYSETVGEYPGGVQSSSMQRGYWRAFFNIIMDTTVICFVSNHNITDVQLNAAGINIKTAKSGFLFCDSFFYCLKLFLQKVHKS